jgi:predicted membrane GTPase involved in stress response
MHLDMPIQQLVRRTDTRFQRGFAHEAMDLLPKREDFLLQPSKSGLVVLGRNEDALATPVETLRDVYGPKLHVEAPSVRLIRGVQVQEPIMHLRVSAENRFREAIKDALSNRGAAPEEEYVRERYCVLRYEAPLRRLLGVPGELATLTNSTARHCMALSHYALVLGHPGGDAA